LALLSWLSDGSGKARRLLADYADESFVHASVRGALSREQRDENLGVFVASIDRRISRLRAFAAELGMALPVPDGDRSKVEAIGQALDRLCKSQLSGLTAVEPALAMDWRAREPQGLERQVQTLIIDLGAYCGEVGIRCAPRHRWVIDETRYTPATIMDTSGRVVIGHDPAVIASAMRNHVDAIAIAAFALTQIVHFRKVKAKGLWRPNYFHFLSDLADGRDS
jgi:hypothetical protein